MAGRDRLTGGNGADVFWFSGNLYDGPTRALTAADTDVISDFAAGVDKLKFAAFKENPFGFEGLRDYWDGEALGPAAFLSLAEAETASTADQQLVYDSESGTLYYDADGSGVAKAVVIVTLTGKPPLTPADVVFEVL